MSGIPYWKKLVSVVFGLFLMVFLSGFWFFHHHENQAPGHVEHSSWEESCDLCDAFFTEKESYSFTPKVSNPAFSERVFVFIGPKVPIQKGGNIGCRAPPELV